MVDYYQDHYEIYHQRTFSIDPAPFLVPFVKGLTAGARVLDIGCGSGRDLCWLKKHGFVATGFERSAGLAAIARRLSGCPVIEGDFENFDFSTLTTDAVLLCGSLVHVPHDRLPRILKRICRSMAGAFHPSAGCKQTYDSSHPLIYLSLKEGDGDCTSSDGRRFYLWRDHQLRQTLTTAGFHIIRFSRSDSAMGNKDVWLSYDLRPPVPGR